MSSPKDFIETLKHAGKSGVYYSLAKLQSAGFSQIKRLPVCLKILLEGVLRNCGQAGVSWQHVERLANWKASAPGTQEVPFIVSRVVLQDFTGVPLLVDLAAMRDAVAELGEDPKKVEPRVPVDLVVDHSVQVDQSRTKSAFEFNLKREFERNRERYQFLKWGQHAFKSFSVVPPSVGIVHQVNLEYLAKVVFETQKDGQTLFYPDTLVGTDSHTTMVNGLGVIGWGVGGIEAESAMLGQPIYIQMPKVVGVYLTGELGVGVTATDFALTVTELLRKHNVVGKFVEFYGPGAEALSVADRSTVANMAPEYGATMGYFPIDEKTVEYMRQTGRSEALATLIEDYYKAQGIWGVPKKGDVDYTEELELDLSTLVPSVAGPKRPQDRVNLPDLPAVWDKAFGTDRKQLPELGIQDGSVVIAAITSCTNTSNPSVMLAAGLLAKNAVEKGLEVPEYVKTSLAPGSRVVTEYLKKAGLQNALDALGFQLVGYGCTTCIGNSGPLPEKIENAVRDRDFSFASVLSGNRNFEARIHPRVKGNFLMSPPLVIAFALAGRVDIDLTTQPLGLGKDGQPVFLKDIWPSEEEVRACIHSSIDASMFLNEYKDFSNASEEWIHLSADPSETYHWDPDSTYIQKPPFFEASHGEEHVPASIQGMRPLAIFGDSVTTDHISPAGAIPSESAAADYLRQNGVQQADFNSFGSRRGNDRVMTRGTFANVRIANQLAEGQLGGHTKHFPSAEKMRIFDAAQRYHQEGTPLIILAGRDYGMGSSRDWAAKGTQLLGVKAVLAKSFERIHRSNLIGMGVLPLEFKEADDVDSLLLTGEEQFSLPDLAKQLIPGGEVTIRVDYPNGGVRELQVTLRIDTDIERAYYAHGGILPYVLKELLKS